MKYLKTVSLLYFHALCHVNLRCWSDFAAM